MLLLWLFFVNVMRWKDQLATMPLREKLYKYPLGYIGFAGDILWNIVFATVLFIQRPPGDNIHDWTLTHRLRVILRNKNPEKLDIYRRGLAMFMCKYMIEPWDPGHCGLEAYY